VANQFFAIADQAGVDYTNILRAVREDYPRAADLPGPGFAAGPCLFKDTMQLAAFTSDHFPLGQAAMQINEGMPAYIVSSLERRHGSLRGRTIGILGMAFKAESDDIRASLSFKLRKLLEWPAPASCARTVRGRRPQPLEDVLAGSEILVIGARTAPTARSTSPARGRRHLERDRRRDPAERGEGPRHRRGRVHLRLSRRGAARRGHEVVGSTTSTSTGG
jgi:UDP-N-acetyl-D-mannosaminuronic acid dehydrogenase